MDRLGGDATAAADVCCLPGEGANGITGQSFGQGREDRGLARACVSAERLHLLVVEAPDDPLDYAHLFRAKGIEVVWKPSPSCRRLPSSPKENGAANHRRHRRVAPQATV